MLDNKWHIGVVPMLLTREDMLPIPGVGIRVFIKVADSLGIEVDNSQLIAETELTTVAGLEHSLKEDPPDAGTSGEDRNVDDDIAMMEGDGPGVPLDGPHHPSLVGKKTELEGRDGSATFGSDSDSPKPLLRKMAQMVQPFPSLSSDFNSTFIRSQQLQIIIIVISGD
nr:hypothetical protein Iba_chr03bCG2710 [Ipomoea batatas]